MIQRIHRFNTHHSWPFVVAEIGHRFGFGDPGIPNHGGVRSGFADDDCACQQRIVDGAWSGGVQINAIGFIGEDDVAVIGETL